MKTTKRILAILLSLFMLVGLFTLAVSAEGEDPKTCTCSAGHEMRLLIDQSCNENLKDGEKNYMVFICDDCNETIKVEGKLPHDFETIKGTKATCTQDGLKDGNKCKVCGKIEQETLKASGHVDNGDGYCSNCKADLAGDSRCAYCHHVHGSDFNGKMTAFFHNIALFFQNMFNR